MKPFLLMAFSITYSLENSGWASAQLTTEQKSEQTTISYLHDTLANLTDAALSLLTTPLIPQKVIFMSEPGESQLRLTPERSGSIQVELRRYDDWQSWGMCPEEKYQCLLQTESTALAFALTVQAVLDNLWLTYGPELYKAKWLEHDFPTNQYCELTRLLAV